jgi:hypothetical protein
MGFRIRSRHTCRYGGTARQESIFNADDRRCTQNTLMVSWGSQARDHAFDFQARLADIEQQAQRQAGRFQTIDALHPMRVTQLFDRLQLDQRHAFDQQVRAVVATTTPW